MRASAFCWTRNVPAGVGGTLPPRLAPGGGNGKGGVQIPCCRRPIPVIYRIDLARPTHDVRQRLRAAWMRSPQSI
jgi:hypothetical protein